MTWVVIALVVGALVFIYFKYLKKKPNIDGTKPDIKDSKKTTPVKEEKPSNFSPNVAKLQAELNAKLPADYPKLVVDGISGPKTRAAIAFLEANSAKLPTNTNAAISVKIDMDNLVSKGKSVLDFLATETPVKYTGLGLLYNAIN